MYSLLFFYSSAVIAVRDTDESIVSAAKTAKMAKTVKTVAQAVKAKTAKTVDYKIG